jgi:hypothetical protein
MNAAQQLEQKGLEKGLKKGRQEERYEIAKKAPLQQINIPVLGQTPILKQNN